jgi:sugar transferase EpsL
MFKFRTMTTHIGPDGKPLPDERRLTPFGRWLRSTSLDELPELLNVLAGKMSLVGPRPLMIEYLPLYNARQARRHDVRPGITGWSQINGRNTLSWQEKFEYDVWYVEHWNLLLDARIVLRTGWSVLTREGVNPEGRDVVEDFTGNEPTSRPS